MPKILARAHLVLRETCWMPRLVNADYSNEAAQKGNTIDVPIPTAVGTSAVSPSNTPPSSSDIVTSRVQVTLDNWQQNDAIHLTDKELAEVDRNEHFLPMQLNEAIKALASDVNEDLMAEYARVYGCVGTAATTPFGSDTSDVINARKLLNEQLSPKSDRRMVIDHAAEASALQLASLVDFNTTGDASVKAEAELGRKLGFWWFSDDEVPTHTTGAAGTWLTDQADIAIGDTGIHCDGATTTASAGDVFTVAGDTQQYTIVTSGTLATNDVDITFQPAAKVAWADSAAMTFVATHVANLAFHRDAWAFATRPLATSSVDLELGSQIMSMTDPQTNLVLRLEVSRQHKQVAWEFDILWGARIVRPELAVRVLG
ncbi:MAG: hypothetical protein GY856_36785 [bacterium]|nr:hypothetical protein [bacterium]